MTTGSPRDRLARQRIAPPGTVWVCAVCGRTAKDRHGHPDADPGWDVSCMLHAVLAEESSLVRDERGRVTYCKEVGHGGRE